LPLQGVVILNTRSDSQGGALGWHVAAPSGRDSRSATSKKTSEVLALYSEPGEDYRPLRPRPFAGAFGSGGASASESLKSIVLDCSLTSAVRVVVRTSPYPAGMRLLASASALIANCLGTKPRFSVPDPFERAALAFSKSALALAEESSFAVMVTLYLPDRAPSLFPPVDIA